MAWLLGNPMPVQVHELFDEIEKRVAVECLQYRHEHQTEMTKDNVYRQSDSLRALPASLLSYISFYFSSLFCAFTSRQAMAGPTGTVSSPALCALNLFPTWVKEALENFQEILSKR
jgi:hypothetical protein